MFAFGFNSGLNIKAVIFSTSLETSSVLLTPYTSVRRWLWPMSILSPDCLLQSLPLFAHFHMLTCFFYFSLFGNLVKYCSSTFVFKVKVVGFILFQISTQNSVSYSYMWILHSSVSSGSLSMPPDTFSWFPSFPFVLPHHRQPILSLISHLSHDILLYPFLVNFTEDSRGCCDNEYSVCAG